MIEDKTGGPAFPLIHETEVSDGLIVHKLDKGLSVRDYFAGQMMAGMGETLAKAISTANPQHGDGTVTPQSVVKAGAELAYIIADAMLEARKG